MATFIICLILLCICIFSVKSYMKKLSRGCCGAGGEGRTKKIRVADKDPSHYPYQAALTVEGMTCQNCAARVENALNSLEGVWASVDLSKKQAQIRMKEQLPKDRLKEVIRQAGYIAY